MLSKAGLGSRTEARSWIGSGRVKVNGKLIQTPDHWVDIERDLVMLDDKPLTKQELRYVLLNKPKGYLTTYKDPENRPTVYDLLPGVGQFVGTVGRLDLDTSGLLLLTNDSALAEGMTESGVQARQNLSGKGFHAADQRTTRSNRQRRGTERWYDSPRQSEA